MGESTRKNPDKYIEQLKNQLEDSRKARRDLWGENAKLRGRYWSDCWTGAEYVSRCTTDRAEKLHLNQRVVVEGRVTGYKQVEDDTHPHLVSITLNRIRLKED